jgi:hypothetical protein
MQATATHTQEKNMNENFMPKMPEFKATKSGYEIRTEILGMAKDMVTNEFHAKWQGWEVTAERDDKTGQIVTKVGMPQFPGLEQVLDTAQRMYEFVNVGNINKPKK